MKTQIKCPECQTLIDVNDVLKHQIEEGLRKEIQSKYKERENQLKKQLDNFEQERESFEEKIKQTKKDTEKAVRQKIKEELTEEKAEEMHQLKEELKAKSEKVKEFNKAQLEIEKLRREKNEMRSEIELESQKKLNVALQEVQEKAKKKANEENEMVINELKMQLEAQKKLTAEMKRKQEQGSMQLQGEVQELAIEEWLANQFPLDTIEEIKKGARGADCLQTVNTREIPNCGKIYIESKRSKNFSETWIEKFKGDIREKGADIGVLVTEVMPSGMDRMGLKDGVWVCSYHEFKGLCAVLRQTLIQVSQAVASQENKGDKMVMLYDFLTSNEFRMQIEGIVEGFTQMQHDLQSEKNSMNRIWKKREKQIEKVVTNTLHMHGAIKGIAGNAIQTVKALEMSESEIEQLADNDN